MDWSTYKIWIAILGVTAIVGTAESSLSGWKKTPSQYHIQTDEGEERFFKFQTFNGQYRKERRLDDGTVIGSYGWVDPAGYLRMTDYIADSKGYRVVKELKEYVGTNSIMEDTPPQKYVPTLKKHAVKVAKQPNVFFANIQDTTTIDPYVDFNSVSVTPTISPFVSTSPKNSLYYPEPGKNGAPHRVFVTSGLGPVKPVQLNSIYYYPEESRQNATFTSPSYVNAPAAVPVRVSGTSGSRFPVRRPPIEVFRQTNSEAAPGVETSSGDVFQSYTTPLRNQGTGFIYKIPNQYHKEETELDGSRQGSFGYVDPFGIRRVIHYKAGSQGFEHLKDFKYVGRQY